MKTKIYFIISSITQIILSIYTIVISEELVKSQIEIIKETYSFFPIEYQERVMSLFQNNGSLFFIIMSSIGILLNTIILIYSIKNKIQEKKTAIITFGIISFLTTGNSLVMLLSIINFTILLADNSTNQKSKKEKKEIPKLQRKENSKKEIILGIILFIIYFSQFVWARFIPNTLNALLITNTVFDIIMLTLCILFLYKELKNDIILFIKNIKEYIYYILPKLGIAYLIYTFSSLIVMLISGEATSVNQETLETIPSWFLIPTAIIWAPIVEEILFRCILRKFIKNDKIFIILSALIFGLLHTINEATIINVFLLAIPYGILGGFLAYIYTKTNNIFSNISCHALQNTVAVLLSLLI